MAFDTVSLLSCVIIIVTMMFNFTMSISLKIHFSTPRHAVLYAAAADLDVCVNCSRVVENNIHRCVFLVLPDYPFPTAITAIAAVV